MPHFILRSMFVFIISRGRIHFAVQGEGTWTMELGNIHDPICRGLRGEPNLEVYFSAAAFQAFVAGTLDPKPAIRSGQFRAEGDLQLLEHLSALLATPKSPLRSAVGLA